MECPKCGLEIDDSSITCPNCKKVLKVVCPKCKTINEGNTCRKCGYVIVTKCNNCGKINPTANELCSKCKFSLEKSVILNESNTDDFVLLTVDFPNMSEMKSLVGSAKAFNKFKVNLDKIFVETAKELGLRRQIIDNTYVIRFNKDYSFTGSINTSIETVIELLNKIARLNCKLVHRKDASIRCNISLMKKTINSDPYDYKLGLNINMIQDRSGDKIKRVLSAFQIITDANIFDALNVDYKFTPLNSVMVNGVMTMFYELDLKDQVIIDEELFTDDEDDSIKVPNFVQNLLIEQDKLDGEVLAKVEKPFDPDAIYDLESINFSKINCDFIRTENIDVFYHIVNKLQSVPLGIVGIKTAPMYVPYSLKIINEIEQLKIYNNIITITCYDEMKYSPYAFFRDLVSAIFEYTVSQQLFNTNDFSAFKSVDPKDMIRDLITLTDRDIKDVIDTRNEYFDIFLTLLNVIPNTLIFIENFDKVDASSYDVLKFLFEHFEELKVSYLISYDKDFSLHKDSHFLLEKPYYTEITLKPTPFEKIISDNKEFYKNIMDDFYFHRIAKYACGSILFLDISIQYLLESGVYQYTDKGIQMVNPKTIIIPSNLSKLLKRRINLLKDDMPTMKFLVSVILLGTRIDMHTVESLGFENSEEIMNKLSDMGYIYFYNNCMYFPNYNLLRENLLEVISKVDLKKIATDLFSKVFVDDMPSPVKSYLYTLLGEEGNAFLEWEKLASVNLHLGDFASYLNCTVEILKLLENPEVYELKDGLVDEYKHSLYENIAHNLYDYVPNTVDDIAEVTLKNLEKSPKVDDMVELCNKMINGALLSFNYNQALALTHKVLSLIPNASINPKDANFNIYFLLMSLIHVEILFNMGAMEECIDIGYKVLNVIDNDVIDNVRPDYISKGRFDDMIKNCVGYVAIANVIQLKGNVADFLTVAYSSIDFIPKSYDIFIKLQDFLLGQKIELDESLLDDDVFSQVIYHLLDAFTMSGDSPENFAEVVYRAKLVANKGMLRQLEVFCDLLIGYAYVLIGSYQKASSIIYKIIKTVKYQGMQLLEHVAWYLLSDMNIRQKKFDVAYGMLQNSIIVMDKYGKASDYIILLFKYNLFKVMMSIGELQKAQICLNQAHYITQKYGIDFEFDIEPEHYISAPSDDALAPDDANSEVLDTIVEVHEEILSDSQEGVE